MRHPVPSWTDDTTNEITPALWESLLGSAVAGLEHPPAPAGLIEWTRSANRAFDLYRYLTQEGRASSLVETAPRTIRSLLVALGEAKTRCLLGRFWQLAAPAFTNAQEGRAFLDFISTSDIALAGLDADVAGDRAMLRQLGRAHQ
jgi:hypothetical protein